MLREYLLNKCNWFVILFEILILENICDIKNLKFWYEKIIFWCYKIDFLILDNDFYVKKLIIWYKNECYFLILRMSIFCIKNIFLGLFFFLIIYSWINNIV